MTYVTYEEKSATERAADRKADERWMKDHAPVYAAPSPTPYRPGVDAAYGAVASAH